MSAFAAWLMGFAKSFLAWLYNNIIDLLQGAIDGFCTFATSLISLLPSGSVLPAHGLTSSGSWWSVAVNAMNWILPIGYLVNCTVFVCAAMLSYLVLAPVLRWAKLLT